MKIFISWSGPRSEALATALKEWLPLVLYYSDPWLSRSDIDAGGRWGVEIAKGLEACNFGIICITRENRDAPWILFEAGALAKSMQDGKVIPLLLDIDKKEISGPLAQFQAKKVEEGEIKELILSLNRSAVSPVPDATLEKLFLMVWPDIASKIAAIPEIKGGPTPSRPEGEILEELVAGFRNLETRLAMAKEADAKEMDMRLQYMHHEGLAWKVRRARGPRSREMLRMWSMVANGPQDPLQILFAASFLRDDAPWIYELATEIYRAVKSGDQVGAKELYTRLMDTIKALRTMPFLEDSDLDWKPLLRIFEEYRPQVEYIEGRESAEMEDDAALQALKEGIESRRTKRSTAD